VSSVVAIRPGAESDAVALMSMWDRAVAWLVARGQTMQWGAEPVSERPGSRERALAWATSSMMRVAEIDGHTVGVSVIGDTPPSHVPAIVSRETYLHFLLTDRDHAGKGIGSDLVRRAAADAREAGSAILRVDCWAGAPSLVAWYERQGFVRSDSFTVDVRGGWHGQVFEMIL